MTVYLVEISPDTYCLDYLLLKFEQNLYYPRRHKAGDHNFYDVCDLYATMYATCMQPVHDLYATCMQPCMQPYTVSHPYALYATCMQPMQFNILTPHNPQSPRPLSLFFTLLNSRTILFFNLWAFPTSIQLIFNLMISCRIHCYTHFVPLSQCYVILLSWWVSRSLCIHMFQFYLPIVTHFKLLILISHSAQALPNAFYASHVLQCTHHQRHLFIAMAHRPLSEHCL